MYYVYILFSEKDKLLYTGSTPNLKTRFQKHVDGHVKATYYRRPLKLIYYETYLDRQDAIRREIYLKGGKGRGELKIQLKETFNKLKYTFR
jgi:putative endonuclease